MSGVARDQKDRAMKLERLPEVLARVGLRRSKVYSLIREKRFPQPVALGSKVKGFVSEEVDSWIRERIAESRKETVRT